MTEETQETTTPVRKNPPWRIVLAYWFDFWMLFWVVGFGSAALTGHLSSGGFSLQGGPALLMYAAMAAYFVICHMYFRGTLWRHIFRVPMYHNPLGQVSRGWRLFFAFALDMIMLFSTIGYYIADKTGSLTPDGYEMQGKPALLFMGIIAVYFSIGYAFLNGTLWQHILKVPWQPRPKTPDTKG